MGAGFGWAEGTERYLKKIQRFLLQGSLLKRSETIPTTSAAQLVLQAYREADIKRNLSSNDDLHESYFRLGENNPNEGHLDDLTIIKIAKQHEAGLYRDMPRHLFEHSTQFEGQCQDIQKNCQKRDQ
ncbi:hypothetical protein OPV22_004373 [Ensete ventricosum]|uniref:Uncharacterized protein n=1 Tax=Ensete ventricosum TaxID=4639 RepID=A0AAV8S3M4_ENSVE|nr:hypothetical protein OPV22_004373 [Ensete ventricosum]